VTTLPFSARPAPSTAWPAFEAEASVPMRHEQRAGTYRCCGGSPPEHTLGATDHRRNTFERHRSEDQHRHDFRWNRKSCPFAVADTRPRGKSGGRPNYCTPAEDPIPREHGFSRQPRRMSDAESIQTEERYSRPRSRSSSADWVGRSVEDGVLSLLVLGEVNAHRPAQATAHEVEKPRTSSRRSVGRSQ